MKKHQNIKAKCDRDGMARSYQTTNRSQGVSCLAPVARFPDPIPFLPILIFHPRLLKEVPGDA